MLTIVVSQLLEIQGVIHPYFLSKHQLERFLIGLCIILSVNSVTDPFNI